METAAPCCTTTLMALRNQFAHGGGREPHPVFVRLDFLGNTDFHLSFLLATGLTT